RAVLVASVERLCSVVCGGCGSLVAALLVRVAEVWAFARREDHALALNRDGLRVSGKHEFHASLRATSRPAEVPDCDFAIVATKARQVEESFAPVGHHFDQGVVLSALHGLGSEAVIAERKRGQV